MSDILKDLLQAYFDRIDAERQANLSYIARHFIAHPPITLVSDWESSLPLIVISPVSVSLTPDSFEGTYRSDRKTYSISLTGYAEYYDGEYGVIGKDLLKYKSALDLMIDMEAIFNRETFGLSQACVLSSITFGQETIGLGVNTCVLTFDHTWIDRRIGAYE